MRGSKHLITCRCILPTYKKAKDPPLHQFVVFSVEDNDGTLIEKIAQCNNCGIIHKVTGYCESEILSGQEDAKNVIRIEDVALSLNPDIRQVLESYSCDIATYENVQFIVATEKVGEFVILDSEVSEGYRSGKILKYSGRGKFSVEPFQCQEGLS